MASCYNRPDLCNYYCSHKCSIGEKYVPEVEVTELPNIILETIASLNEINPLIGRLIQISRDGKIADDEIHDFALISKKLDEISLAIDSLIYGLIRPPVIIRLILICLMKKRRNYSDYRYQNTLICWRCLPCRN